jgi:hypothetical protein
MVLGSVDVLFVAFVLIQIRYFFGGKANITAQGYTYSEYARRGFYELLAASLMTMLLVVVLDAITHRKRDKEITFRTLSIVMITLTMVMLASAFQRLRLYEDAYGFTRLRVMSGVFMIWLVALFIVLTVQILGHRQQLFWLGCLAAGLCFVFTLNVMNMDGYIASRNIARFDKTGKLDVTYLLSLSDDAIPAIAQLLDRPGLADEHELILVRLGQRLYELDRDRAARDWPGYHFGKARAWRALDEYRAVLKPYMQSLSRFD